MKLNKPLIKKMIKRMSEKPAAYAQQVIVADIKELHVAIRDEDVLPRPDPECGAAGCLIAQAIICDAPTVKQGLDKLKHLDRQGKETDYAAKVMGLPHGVARDLFYEWGTRWPQPYRAQFAKAKTYRGQARAAVGLLKAILKTDGKILEA